MKNSFGVLIIFCAALQLLSACKKSEAGNSDSSLNQWRVNDSVFTATGVYSSTNPIYALAFNDEKKNPGYFHGLVFQFSGSTTPPTGKYKITSTLSGATNEVYVDAYKYLSNNGTINDPINYIAVSVDSPQVTVTANGNKLTISLPEILAVRVEAPHDSVRISAALMQER